MKTVSAAWLPMITIDRRTRRPLHRQVYEAYRAAIAEGTLRAAQRVPSTRVLATELGVSRIPVLHAYAQLVAEGYFQSRVGAGTHIATSLARPAGHSRPILAEAGIHSVRSLPSRLSQRDGAFLLGQVAQDQFPHRVWNNLVARHARRTSPTSLNDVTPMGLWALREAIAGYVRTARAVKCEPEQIMIVSGAHEAIAICAQALLNAGESVWAEEPGCPRARNLLALHGCRTVAVPVDEQGLNVAEGARRAHDARAALVTPSHQQVLGVSMSAARRMQLLDWAARAKAWILEVDADSEYRQGSERIASLQGIDPHSRVLYIGTFSNLMFPSLRLGYLVLPAELLERFRSMRLSMDAGPPTLFQAVVADFIREGHFCRHLRRMGLLYGERRTELLRSLREQPPRSMEIVGKEAGMHVALTLDGVDDLHIVERAARAKLWVAPLSPCYGGDVRRHGLMLGFGNVPLEAIPGAVGRLRAAIEGQ